MINRNHFDRKIYAVRHGTLKGNFLVYIKTIDESHEFLMLPEMKAMTIEQETFQHGLDNKIVDLIKKLPHNVYQICYAQYNEAKAKSDINRLKQSATSSGVDSRKRKNKR